MPLSKIGEWWRSRGPFASAGRDYLAGVVDGDGDAHAGRPRRRGAHRTMRVRILIEIERGKGNLLLECAISRRELSRFVDEADEALDRDPCAIVPLYPEPEDGVEQDRIGVPMDRLIRVEREDGEVLYAPGDRMRSDDDV